MKSFRQFLESNNENIHDVVNEIRKQCKPFLTAAKSTLIDYPLYRGDSISNTNALNIKRVRKDRKPLNTFNAIHEILDEYLFQKFGKYFRSQSVFATTKITEANFYGTVHLFFPKGDFEYVWSEKIQDFHTDAEKLMKAYLRNNKFDYSLEGRERAKEELKNPNSDLKNFLDGLLKYKNSGMMKALKSHSEIMFHCDRYYLLNPQHFSRLIPGTPLSNEKIIQIILKKHKSIKI